MRLSDLFDDGQSQIGPINLRGVAHLKDGLMLLLGNAGAAVDHVEPTVLQRPDGDAVAWVFESPTDTVAAERVRVRPSDPPRDADLRGCSPDYERALACSAGQPNDSGYVTDGRSRFLCVYCIAEGMPAPADRDDRTEGVEFVHEADGSITARDIETGVASFGETKAEALAMLADALALHEDGGEPIEDEGTFLREIGIGADELPDEPESLPEFMQ